MPGDHHPKYKSCVDKVKAKGDDVNPYAVCHASTGLTKMPTSLTAIARSWATRPIWTQAVMIMRLCKRPDGQGE